MPKQVRHPPLVGVTSHLHAGNDNRAGPPKQYADLPPHAQSATNVGCDTAVSTVAGTLGSRGTQDLAAQTAAVILAGGKGTRLGALTRHECKPALPFGGRYRNIDFSLSNCVNSGIRQIGVATQYKDASLLRHLSDVWPNAAERGSQFVAPWRAGTVGYSGTADAVFQNWARIESLNPRLVLILAGDHVYQMDYRPMLERHLLTGADLTVGCVEVPIEVASQFGVMSTDASHRVVRFSEKPRHPQSLPGRPDRALGSMGIYVFNREMLGRILQQDAEIDVSSHDFGADLVPRLVDTAKVVAYPFTADAEVGGGYWRDVGTVSAYWQAHMELLDGIPGFRLDDPDWPIHAVTSSQDTGVAYLATAGRASSIERSLLAGGCGVDDATLHRSVLFEGVTVGTGAQLRHAVVLPNAVIGRGCRLSNVIVGAGVHVPDGTVIFPKGRQGEDETPTLITAETRFSNRYLKRLLQCHELPRYAAGELQQHTGT